MPEQPDEFRVNTPAIATVGPPQGIHPILIADIIPPRFPEGVELGATISIFQPGAIAPVVANVPIPAGAMLCYIMPQEAANFRADLYAAVAREQARVRAEMERRGAMGRRG